MAKQKMMWHNKLRKICSACKGGYREASRHSGAPLHRVQESGTPSASRHEYTCFSTSSWTRCDFFPRSIQTFLVELVFLSLPPNFVVYPTNTNFLSFATRLSYVPRWGQPQNRQTDYFDKYFS